MDKLEISRTEVPEIGAQLINLSGGIDVFSYLDLKKSFEELGVDGSKDALLVDMSQVSYVGSSGWSVLFLQSSLQEKQASVLILFAMNERVERSLNTIMPRKRHVNVAPDLEGAKSVLSTLRNSIQAS